MRVFFLFFSIYGIAFSSIVGNPGLPTFLQKGLFYKENTRPAQLRFGYVADYVYDTCFEDEFLTEESSDQNLRMSIYAPIFTVNLFQRVDLYTMIGGMQLEIKDTIFAPRRFVWVVGTKATFYHGKRMSVGGDVKYLHSKQKPSFFLIEGFPALLLTNFALDYTEIQGAFAATYQWKYFAPYIGITYLDAKVQPKPHLGIFEIQELELVQEFDASSIVNKKKWGFVFGLTLLSDETMSVNVESRFFDQNAVNVTGELTF